MPQGRVWGAFDTEKEFNKGGGYANFEILHWLRQSKCRQDGNPHNPRHKIRLLAHPLQTAKLYIASSLRFGPSRTESEVWRDLFASSSADASRSPKISVALKPQANFNNLQEKSTGLVDFKNVTKFDEARPRRFPWETSIRNWNLNPNFLGTSQNLDVVHFVGKRALGSKLAVRKLLRSWRGSEWAYFQLI